jgi:biopolymer transport protein ExbD
MRIPIEEEAEAGVAMSPLIDCVFLLLIFFLVTTMMKKWETQIPLTVPEITSSLSERKTAEHLSVIAIGDDNAIYEVSSRDAFTGEVDFQPIADLATHLSALRDSQGVDFPLEITAGRDVPVERVIAIFDHCQQAGFMQTRVRLGSKPNLETAIQE